MFGTPIALPSSWVLWWMPHLMMYIRYAWTLPLAALLKFARLVGGSFYASFFVHASYNLVVCVFPVWLLGWIHELPVWNPLAGWP